MTGNVADRQDGPGGLSAFKGPRGIFLQRDGFVPFFLKPETERADDAFADDGAILVDAAAGRGLGAGTHEKGDLVHAFFQPSFPEGGGDVFKNRQAQGARVVEGLYGHTLLLWRDGSSVKQAGGRQQ